MSKTKLFIVRHGETDYNKNGMMQGRSIDAPLNKTGLIQSENVAQKLEQENPEILVSSSMKRAIQTAEPLSGRMSAEINSFRDLDEMDFGDFEGKRSADIHDELINIHNTWASGEVDQPISGGESPLEVFHRANGRIVDLLKQHTGKTTVIVLHGRLIRILLSEWLGFGLKNMHKIEHANGAINHLVKNDLSYEAIYLNSTDHLTT